jgi:hypothetical protein
MTNTAACLSFIESQQQQIQYLASTASTIAPAQTWLPGYTGPVSGTFTLSGVSYGTQQLCPITITSPAGGVPADYRGIVEGQAATVYAGYTVLSFLNVNGTESIADPQTMVSAHGTFSLDLSSVPAHAPGAWNFALQDPATYVWPVGAYWPSPPTYTNLEVQSWVITDTEYLTASQPAREDGTFYFPASQPGRKMFLLYDTAAQANIAVYVPTTGNVRSYLVTAGQPGYGTSFCFQSYVYDQAMCLIAAVARGQAGLAQQLVNGLLQFQTPAGADAGGFIFSGQQLNPGYGEPVYRTGAHAIATYALLTYMAAYPGDHSQDYPEAARQALGWLATQQQTSGAQAGLFHGGSGTYDGAVLKAGAEITWYATEHQLDIWHAYVKASAVLQDDSWLASAAALAEAIWTVLYNPATQRFYQGYQPTGPDTGDPLDMHSWAAIWANCVGRPDVSTAVLNRVTLEPFVLTEGDITGYQPEYAADPSGDYPGATPTIWSEGTFFTAYAFQQLGNAAQAEAIIAGIDPEQEPDGSFAYCTVYDPVYGLTPSQCVIGPAWAILANLGTGIWQESESRSASTAPVGTRR